MHAINLKAAWEASDAEAGAGAPAIRVALPLDWRAVPWPGGRTPGLVRLVRRFGRPADPGMHDPPRILLSGLAGVAAMELNGSPIAWRVEEGWHVVEPGELAPRNALAIVVDPAEASRSPVAWGDRAFLECGRTGSRPLGLPGGAE